VKRKVVGWILLFCLSCSSHDAKNRAKSAAADAGASEPPTLIFGTSGLSRSGDGGCVAEVRRGEALPLDVYILFDQSGSMSTPAGNGTRLDAVRAAASDFLNSSQSAGIGFGIGYFGNFPLGHTSCNPDDYSTPSVEIGPLPGQAPALLASLQSVVPTGETPTGPAIRGACSYVDSWDKAHPGLSASMLIVTDGVPEAPISRANGCDPTLDDAVAATKECVTRTGASIYVLGVGPNLVNLDQIAAAGGSDHAYLVDGGDVSNQVLEALNAIRGAALPCGFEIPPAPAGETIDLQRVNVVRTDSDGTRHALVNIPSSDGCGSESQGWYYDPPGAPERITLCESACREVKAQSLHGAIEFALGCQIVTATR
jgi:Mg-chelatase subunit ChlD